VARLEGEKNKRGDCGAARSFGLSLIGRGGISPFPKRKKIQKKIQNSKILDSPKMKTAGDWPDVSNGK